jgi:hypothetical protein
MSEIGRRRLFLGSLAALFVDRAILAQQVAGIDQLGRFEVVPGRPDVVVGVPHATADAGTSDIGRVLCRRVGASGIFVSGFWDGKTRQRINVNRPTEQLIGPDSQVLREWASDRAKAANARYVALVAEAAAGPLRVFYEIHSNHRQRFADSIEVSTLGVSRGEAGRFKDAFHAARDRHASDAPRLEMHVSPVDKVTYPNYGNATSIAALAQQGCAIEHPAGALANRAWRLTYAECLADAILAAQWGHS